MKNKNASGFLECIKPLRQYECTDFSAFYYLNIPFLSRDTWSDHYSLLGISKSSI